MLGTNFHPSYTLNKIYDIMEEYKTHGIDLYDEGCSAAVTNFLSQQKDIEWNLVCVPSKRDMCCIISFTENSHNYMVAFDYQEEDNI